MNISTILCDNLFDVEEKQCGDFEHKMLHEKIEDIYNNLSDSERAFIFIESIDRESSYICCSDDEFECIVQAEISDFLKGKTPPYLSLVA